MTSRTSTDAMPSPAPDVRRATVLGYGGSLWVNGYWPATILSIELRPLRRSERRVLLIGPPFGAGRSVAIDLDAGVTLEAFAGRLADWIETPALALPRAERIWPRVAQRLSRSAVAVQGVAA